MGPKSNCVICEIAIALSESNCVICEIAKIAISQIAKVAKIAKSQLRFLRKLRIFIWRNVLKYRSIWIDYSTVLVLIYIWYQDFKTLINDSYCLAFNNCRTWASEVRFLFGVKISLILLNSRSIMLEDGGRFIIFLTNWFWISIFRRIKDPWTDLNQYKLVYNLKI